MYSIGFVFIKPLGALEFAFPASGGKAWLTATPKVFRAELLSILFGPAPLPLPFLSSPRTAIRIPRVSSISARESTPTSPARKMFPIIASAASKMPPVPCCRCRFPLPPRPRAKALAICCVIPPVPVASPPMASILVHPSIASSTSPPFN